MPPLLTNATALSLRWTRVAMATGYKSTLTTGIASFACHFAPAGGRALAQANAWGIKTAWQVHCDYDLDIIVGDILVITELAGETQSTPQFLAIAGVAPYVSKLLGHKVLVLDEWKQHG